MIVCLCEGLSDRVISQHIRQGRASVRDLARATGAGTHCGACACDLRRMLTERDESAEPAQQGAGAAFLLRR
jgi:bacterioferritin-associated ferredoxin